MTPEKAIKFFDEEIERLERAPIINGCEMTDDWKEQLEICKLAKSALEKQIPMQHHHTRINEIHDEARISICSSCLGCIVTRKDEFPKFCTWCGQALDWSETE